MSQRYISKELTHFVGSHLSTKDDQYSLLVKILNSGKLIPRYLGNDDNRIEINVSRELVSQNEMFNPSVICFCDIPVSEFGIHIDKYSKFGLSFTKSFLIAKGANPVSYIVKNSICIPPDRIFYCILPNSDKVEFISTFIGNKPICNRSDYYNKMIEEYHNFIDKHVINQKDSEFLPINHFIYYEVFSFLKFFDEGRSEEHEENYYMEREWRVLGKVEFELNNVCRIILPESYSIRLRDDVERYNGQLTFVEYL